MFTILALYPVGRSGVTVKLMAFEGDLAGAQKFTEEYLGVDPAVDDYDWIEEDAPDSGWSLWPEMNNTDYGTAWARIYENLSRASRLRISLVGCDAQG